MKEKKHMKVQQLRATELENTIAGGDHITCGVLDDDLCEKLTVVTMAPNETHKVVLA